MDIDTCRKRRKELLEIVWRDKMIQKRELLELNPVLEYRFIHHKLRDRMILQKILWGELVMFTKEKLLDMMRSYK